jgi:hypothetical protein
MIFICLSKAFGNIDLITTFSSFYVKSQAWFSLSGLDDRFLPVHYLFLFVVITMYQSGGYPATLVVCETFFLVGAENDSHKSIFQGQSIS